MATVSSNQSTVASTLSCSTTPSIEDKASNMNQIAPLPFSFATPHSSSLMDDGSYSCQSKLDGATTALLNAAEEFNLDDLDTLSLPIETLDKVDDTKKYDMHGHSLSFHPEGTTMGGDFYDYGAISHADPVGAERQQPPDHVPPEDFSIVDSPLSAPRREPADADEEAIHQNAMNLMSSIGVDLSSLNGFSRSKAPFVAAWLRANYEAEEGVSLPRSILYSHYFEHCRLAAVDPVNSASFGKIIRSVFPDLKTRRLGTRGNSKYHYYGIKCKPFNASISMHQSYSQSASHHHSVHQSNATALSVNSPSRGNTDDSLDVMFMSPPSPGHPQPGTEVLLNPAHFGLTFANAPQILFATITSSQHDAKYAMADASHVPPSTTAHLESKSGVTNLTVNTNMKSSKHRRNSSTLSKSEHMYSPDSVPSINNNGNGSSNKDSARTIESQMSLGSAMFSPCSMNASSAGFRYSDYSPMATSTTAFTMEEFQQILKEFIQPMPVQFPCSVSVESFHQFLDLYRPHLCILLNHFINLDPISAESSLSHFWAGAVKSLFKNIVHEETLRIIALADDILYQGIYNCVLYNILTPVSADSAVAIKTIGRGIEGWTAACLEGYPTSLVELKVESSRKISQLLKRRLSLNSLAQSTKEILCDPFKTEQMRADWSLIDFNSVHEHVSWTLFCRPNIVKHVETTFKDYLVPSVSIEYWLEWIQSIVDQSLILAATNTDQLRAHESNARQFLLKWSFLSSILTKDLTLRSVPSFNHFHTMRLFFEEYVLYVVEKRLDDLRRSFMGEVNVPSSSFSQELSLPQPTRAQGSGAGGLGEAYSHAPTHATPAPATVYAAPQNPMLIEEDYAGQYGFYPQEFSNALPQQHYMSPFYMTGTGHEGFLFGQQGTNQLTDDYHASSGLPMLADPYPREPVNYYYIAEEILPLQTSAPRHRNSIATVSGQYAYNHGGLVSMAPSETFQDYAPYNGHFSGQTNYCSMQRSHSLSGDSRGFSQSQQNMGEAQVNGQHVMAARLNASGKRLMTPDVTPKAFHSAPQAVDGFASAAAASYHPIEPNMLLHHAEAISGHPKKKLKFDSSLAAILNG